MSRLNAKDLEILKARGYVNGLTTLRGDEIDEFVKPEEFSMKPNKVVEKTKKVKKVKKIKEKHPLVGTLLHTSWGYNMTMNDFCKILEVSPTGKTVKCQMVSKSINGDPWHPCGNGKAKAGSTVHGPVFRLKVSECLNRPSFHGSYPYCIQKEDDPKEWKAYMGRKGYFSIVSENDEFYENRCD